MRALATRAMRSLLVNLRRLATSSDREVSRYADLVRLAGWFDNSDAEQAHALWASAFGLYSCRHLGFAADAEPAAATSSWWRAPVADVPVMLRSSGERKAAGGTARREDYGPVKAQRLRERAVAEAARARALEELRSLAGVVGDVELSDEARQQLLELPARALSEAGGPVRTTARAEVALPTAAGCAWWSRQCPAWSRRFAALPAPSRCTTWCWSSRDRRDRRQRAPRRAARAAASAAADR